MKKTTKFLLVLAAVVAMTIGAVSTVMAAETYATVDPATWECTDGWYAKDTNGKQIETGWAVDPDGHYYYFSGKKALENAFVVWKGETYYFGKDAIMCEGWVEFTVDNADPVYSIDNGYCAGDPLLDNEKNNPYGKSVWMFFEKGGAAACNKWIETNGLWYYFEDKIMVCDNYMYMPASEDVYYGFSGDGNMHVGWIKASGKFNAERPYESNKTLWLYYNADGSMVNPGWKKIDGSWYFFAEATDENNLVKNGEYDIAAGTRVLLTNVFAKIDNDNANVTYYLDDNGVMQTGELQISKNKKVRRSVAECLNMSDGSKDNSADRTFKFKSNGQLITGKDGNSWYMTANNSVAYKVKDYKLTDKAIATELLSNSSFGIGEKVFNGFRIDGNKVHYYDANGNMVKSDVVTFGQVTIAFDKDGKAILDESPEKGVYVAGRYYYFSNAFGTVTVGDKVIPGCSVRKLSTVSGSSITVR